MPHYKHFHHLVEFDFFGFEENEVVEKQIGSFT